MAYKDRPFGAFLESRVTAGFVLHEAGVNSKDWIGFEDAHHMQVVSHILLNQPDGFHGQDVVNAVGEKSTVYQSLRKFEKRYAILTSSHDRLHFRPARRLYVSTELGRRVFNLFQGEWDQFGSLH